ncbi:LETM1-related biofilm-associated protein [Flavobacterium cerinum]|uniref:LETM1-related biofilm-associated protein n=1 Tax=Flavobacterium cerinum TaxID=2502784 RepID=A0ABY5IRD8_9FLAO|nr:LETM1-related biofilm-associated protein [Flavobacterium cerinum]UUC44001.1 LETM1-related biofilm-associated protein [Flavobacterium cerinum]
MINPSINGWIDKFFIKQSPLPLPVVVYPKEFYTNIRNTGFIYGHVVDFVTDKPIETKGWTSEELTKVALLNSLYGVYGLITHDSEPKKFILKAISFYNQMNPEGFNLLKKMLPSSSPSNELEKMISERVRTNDNIISKNFSHILTNALLFMDVLAFRQYLLHGEIPNNYLKKLEETIVSLVALALNTKTNKSTYDDLLIKLFESSVRFTKFNSISIQDIQMLEFDYFNSDLEKNYLLDITGMALWSDNLLEESETQFMYNLAEQLQIDKEYASESICAIDEFIMKYQKEIPYFRYSNPVKHFYDQATQNVIVLITRNKNRLLKEISESGELMLLLAKSTHKDLDQKEKKKVKKQLLDICKTIPSLTIFLLPGGSLLLPILIKFIPKLLPSAFNENLDIE